MAISSTSVTSVMQLSSRAESLLRILYRKYLDKRAAGISKSEAFSMGDIDYIRENLAVNLSYADVCDASDELCRGDLIFKSLWGYIALNNEFLAFCERNYIKV